MTNRRKRVLGPSLMGLTVGNWLSLPTFLLLVGGNGREVTFRDSTEDVPSSLPGSS